MHIIFITFILLLASLASACKCWNDEAHNQGFDQVRTRRCCEYVLSFPTSLPILSSSLPPSPLFFMYTYMYLGSC